MDNEKIIISVDKKSLLEVLAWFREYEPSGKECFYQVDNINLACPELGISVFELLVKAKLYSPPED